MDEKLDQMEKQLQQLTHENQKMKAMEKELEKARLQIETLKEENEKLSANSSAKKITTIEHSNDFWVGIDIGCSKKAGPYGTDSIKTMVKNGKMTVHDSDYWECTLLIIAASNGAYDLAQFLINNVCNICKYIDTSCV